MREVLANNPYRWLSCIALIIFFSFFTALIVHLFRRSNRAHYSRMEHLPLLEEGPQNEQKK